MKKIKYLLLLTFMLYFLSGCYSTTDDCNHLSSDWITDYQPTCSIPGSSHKECTICGELLDTQIEPKVDHQVTKIENEVKATCLEDGFIEGYCKYCQKLVTVTKEKLGHKLEHHNAAKPTCKNVGYKDYDTCENCEYTTYEEIEKIEHNESEFIIDVEATCLKDGSKHTECKVCKEVIRNETIKALGHQFEDGECTNCKEKNYSKGLEYKLGDDKKHYIVSGIGECKDKNIIIPEKYQNLFVTEIGKKAFYGCATIITIQLPDTIIKIDDKAFANCENLIKINLTDNVQIGIDVFKDSIVVDIIIKHTLVYVPRKEATCKENGNIDHYLCGKCEYYYKDAEGKIRIYDVIIKKSHNFVNGICTKCGEIQDEVCIVSVEKIDNLGKFPLGTLENAIGLPNEVYVYTADGKKHSVKVLWDMNNYDKSKVGTYIIKGIIQTNDLYFKEGVSNSVETTVEIVDTIKGTADIVFILDISGSMEGEINNVKNNLINLAAQIENYGVSARYSVITYSDFTVSGANEITTVIKNGTSDWFTNAIDCKNAISSITLAYGGDTPEAAIDGLGYANTLTTRKDVRTFYILLTDAGYKVNNNYGYSNLNEVTNVLYNKGVNVSVITSSSYYSSYQSLTDKTGGIMCDINDSFCNVLYNTLIPIIYDKVMD